MSTPEIDWTNDREVVEAAIPGVADGTYRGPMLGWYWSQARKDPLVVEWEAKHRPTVADEYIADLAKIKAEQVPAVDLPKVLYDALKGLESLHFDDWYDDLVQIQQAREAIKLYEAKGAVNEV